MPSNTPKTFAVLDFRTGSRMQTRGAAEVLGPDWGRQTSGGGAGAWGSRKSTGTSWHNRRSRSTGANGNRRSNLSAATQRAETSNLIWSVRCSSDWYVGSEPEGKQAFCFAERSLQLVFWLLVLLAGVVGAPIKELPRMCQLMSLLYSPSPPPPGFAFLNRACLSHARFFFFWFLGLSVGLRWCRFD